MSQTWEKAAEWVESQIGDLIDGDERCCSAFVRWLGEQNAEEYAKLVEEWAKTPDGKNWVYHWTEEAYEAGKDSDNLGGER